MSKLTQDLMTQKNLLRFMVFLIIGLSLAAGYYHSIFTTEHKKYLQLEDKYVRVRSQLGREETQRLIDQSHQEEIQTDW